MRFALIGAAGYIAQRHMRAIKEVGGDLVAALDPSDSVGIIDSYFPQADFFTEYERFDRHLEKLRRSGRGVDYVVVCSPNYLHDAHCRLGLRVGANVICEKPAVLKPWNMDALHELERETGKRIFVILQLRLHPAIISMRERYQGHHHIELNYSTPRGKWYDVSWKGDTKKSGGLAMNIGVHLFDMLLWSFGQPLGNSVDFADAHHMSGYLDLERASVHWELSIDQKDGKERSLEIDGETIDFTSGFENLHTDMYRQILSGNGFTLADARPAIDLVYHMRR